MNRKIVITGMGMISPLGLDVETSWQAAIHGQSGAVFLDELDEPDFRVRIAATVKNFDAAKYMPAKEVRRYDPFIQYAIASSIQAIEQAGLEKAAKLDKTRVGVLIGSGIGGISLIEDNCSNLINHGARKISPFFIPAAIINMASGLVAIKHGYQGPNLSVATACTTSTHALGLAARLIAYGDADVMIAGGSEKGSSKLGIGGFSAMQALSTRNHEPEKASRPFDADRDGFVLGDGAGVLVLESYEHAKKRGAHVLAELSGFGMSEDALHITAPPEDGDGAQRAMKNALADASLSPDQIDYINAHGTSTPLGDVAESKAIEAVFGEHAKLLPVSSTKSMTGHLLGAAGAIEAIFSIKALLTNTLPPTINLDTPDVGCALDYVPNKMRSATIDHVLSNSFGFGGTNGSLVFSRHDS